MSYILDALRRADAERSRGVVPGLHAQSLPGDAEPAARNYAPLMWAAGGAGVLLAAGVAVLLWAPWRTATAPALEARATLAPPPAPTLAARDNGPVQPAQGELPPAQPGALEPAARPVEPPIGRGQAPAATPEARAPQAYPPRATEPRDAVAQRAAAGRVATLQPRADTRAPVAVPTPAPPPTQPPAEHYGAPLKTAPTPAPNAAPSAAAPNINALPPDVRAQLPHLAVGGAIYSETPSARMVILNGQVFHEGDKPAADTVLELIRLKSAVLNFRGQRYEVSF